MIVLTDACDAGRVCLDWIRGTQAHMPLRPRRCSLKAPAGGTSLLAQGSHSYLLANSISPLLAPAAGAQPGCLCAPALRCRQHQPHGHQVRQGQLQVQHIRVARIRECMIGAEFVPCTITT